jgi:hypothetical protein
VKTNPKRSYTVIENERFGLVFAKTGSKLSGTCVCITPVPVSEWAFKDFVPDPFPVFQQISILAAQRGQCILFSFVFTPSPSSHRDSVWLLYLPSLYS